MERIANWQSFLIFSPAINFFGRMKDTWKDYFSFNKKQRNGIAVLLSGIALLLAYLFLADYFPPSTKPADFSSFRTEIEKAGIKPSSPDERRHENVLHIDINTADTNVLMTIPNMTSYCASMIVKYRKKLGGYYSMKQLTQVWGMDSAIFNALTGRAWVDTGAVHKININTADIKQLAYHPYIRYYLAKAIVNYREEHGLFPSLSALHKMAAVDDTTYLKIIPYLTIGKK